MTDILKSAVPWINRYRRYIPSGNHYLNLLLLTTLFFTLSSFDFDKNDKKGGTPKTSTNQKSADEFQDPCYFYVSCPYKTDLGTFDCKSLDKIPPKPTTLQDLINLGFKIGTPCYKLIITAYDDYTPNVCSKYDQTITRSITVWDDKNYNGYFDYGEVGVKCYLTFKILADVTPPYIKCPDNITVECYKDVPYPDTSKVVAYDNCSKVYKSFVKDSVYGSCPKYIYRTYKATDECGNTAYCYQTITVYDKTPPTIYCPKDTTVECYSYVPKPDIYSVKAYDNCGGTVYVSFVKDSVYGSCPKYIYRTYKATDECGNYSYCYQTITVYDKTPPYIKCPYDITVECFKDVPYPDTSKVEAYDNCGIVYKYFVKDSVYGSCPKYIYRTYKAVDYCGNTSYCYQTITVYDKTPPYIKCPYDITVECYKDVPYPDTSKVEAYDNCGKVYKSFVKDSVYGSCPKYIYRTYKATDECGNTSYCYQTITVYDKTPPTIYCPANVSVTCFKDVPKPDIYSVKAYDNCEKVYVSFVKDSVYGSCPKYIYRTYKAVDDCGNTAYCYQTITVYDKTPPTIYCPADITVSCYKDVPKPNTYLVKAYDNCGGKVYVYFVSDKLYGYGCSKYVYRTYKAVDECYNVSYCYQKIYIVDKTPPVIYCPSTITVSCYKDVPQPNIYLVKAYDNCGGTVKVYFVGDKLYGYGCSRYITRTYKAIDECGNVSYCTQRINIYDKTPPVIYCPASVYIGCYDKVPAPNPYYVKAYDNCGGTVKVYFVSDTYSSNYCPKVIYRKYKAVDACGNTSYCTQKIYVGYNTVTTSTTEPGTESLKAAQLPGAAATLGVKALPNPFRDRVQFVISSSVSGKGSLELFDPLGRKVAKVWEGNVSADKPVTVEYRTSTGAQTVLIYQLTVGGKTVTGKLLQAGK